MELLLVLEIFGAVFAIAGAWFMSYDTKDYLYKAFCAYFISNIALIIFFMQNGKIPMLIQFILFTYTAFIGMRKKSSNIESTDKLLHVMLFIALISFCFSMVHSHNISFEISIIDVVAATFAILGSYLLSSHSSDVRKIAFILFVIADSLYVYIGFTNEFYFFLLQSAFFLFTGVRGYIINTRNSKIDIATAC